MSDPGDLFEYDTRRDQGGDGTLNLLAGADSSLLDLADHLLNQGVVISGEVVLGLAGIDLVYLRLSALLCAADRVLPRREKLT